MEEVRKYSSNRRDANMLDFRMNIQNIMNSFKRTDWRQEIGEINWIRNTFYAWNRNKYAADNKSITHLIQSIEINYQKQSRDTHVVSKNGSILF